MILEDSISDSRSLLNDRLHQLIECAQKSPFWAIRFGNVKPSSFEYLEPISKGEILADQARYKPYGKIPSVDIRKLVRLHQSSGTSGNPLVWADTASDWSRLLDQWDHLFGIAGILPADRFFFPFSFGPFLGFWSAFEAATRAGKFCLAGGGMSSVSRLRFIEEHQISILMTTPSYASHLAIVAADEKIDLVNGPVRLLILAGEAGASMAGVKSRLESSWNARVLDHHGMTEVGPVSMECPEAPCELHLLSDHYIIEALPAVGDFHGNLSANKVKELVLTPLSRLGMPLVRYRTGDRVELVEGRCKCGRTGPRLIGGVLGRLDDMLIIRGNNVYPMAIEDWLWLQPGLIDFQAKIVESSGLSRLILNLEFRRGLNGEKEAVVVSNKFFDRFLFRAEVKSVLPDELPKTEHKSKRWIRHCP